MSYKFGLFLRRFEKMRDEKMRDKKMRDEKIEDKTKKPRYNILDSWLYYLLSISLLSISLLSPPLFQYIPSNNYFLNLCSTFPNST